MKVGQLKLSLWKLGRQISDSHEVYVRIGEKTEKLAQLKLSVIDGSMALVLDADVIKMRVQENGYL